MINPEDTKYVWDEENFNIIKKNIMKEKLKMEIEELAIPWSSWNEGNYFLYLDFNKLLTSMFVDLLNLLKEKEINISCGVAMMDLFHTYSRYDFSDNVITIAGCKIIPDLDFNLGKYDLAYDNIILVGQNIKSKIDNTQAVNEVPLSPNKKKSIWERIFG